MCVRVIVGVMKRKKKSRIYRYFFSHGVITTINHCFLCKVTFLYIICPMESERCVLETRPAYGDQEITLFRRPAGLRMPRNNVINHGVGGNFFPCPVRFSVSSWHSLGRQFESPPEFVMLKLFTGEELLWPGTTVGD